jgi:hypothetical protein
MTRRLSVQTLLVTLGLAVLCAAVYARWVADGGFFWDDWQLAARNRFPPVDSPDYAGTLDLALLRYRPVLALLLPAAHKVFGSDPTGHIVLALAINVLTSACLFLYLRTLRTSAVPAALAAALALVFPWSDSMRFWATAAINDFGVVFYLLGTVVSIHGLRSSGRRAVLLGIGGVLLYLLSVLTYEVAGALAVLNVVLYAREAGWRRALRRWPFDAVPVVVALAYVVKHHTRKTEATLGDMVHHARHVFDEALTLLALAVAPFGSLPRGVVLAAVAAVVLAAIVVWSRLAPGEPARARLGNWLFGAGAAAVAVVASYLPIIPADAHYLPLAPGVNNRINLLSAFAYATLVVALAMLFGTLVFARSRERLRTGSLAVGCGLCVIIGAGYVHRTLDDRADWIRGTEAQARILGAIEASVPADRPRGATIYTFGENTYVAPGVPSFSVSWDLKAATRLLLDDRSARAYALSPASGKMACLDTGVDPRGFAFGRGTGQGASYGKAYFVDVPARRAVRITNRDVCQRERARLLPFYRR